MRRLRNTLLTTQSGGARTSTGEFYCVGWFFVCELVLVCGVNVRSKSVALPR